MNNFSNREFNTNHSLFTLGFIASSKNLGFPNISTGLTSSEERAEFNSILNDILNKHKKGIISNLEIEEILKTYKASKKIKFNKKKKVRFRNEINGKSINNTIYFNKNNIISNIPPPAYSTNNSGSSSTNKPPSYNSINNKSLDNILSKCNSIVISYNISWATQKNTTKGNPSEKEFVEYCQNEEKGKKKPKSGLSYCTNNVANFLSDFAKKYQNLDIIGLQEVVKKPTNKILETINKNNNNNFNISLSKIYNKAMVGIIYNKKLKNPKLIVEGNLNLNGGRPYQVIYFPSKKWLVINAHFEHGYYDNQIETLNNEINSKLKEKKISDINRIIFTGDFNKAFSDKTVSIDNFLGKNLICGDSKNNLPKTCCFRNNLKSTLKSGDYIFDSEKQKYFGLPPDLYDKKLPYSDHLPVIGCV